MSKRKSQVSIVLPLAVHEDQHLLLLGQEKSSGKWTAFGSHREKGESVLQAAVRECWEESMGLLGNKRFIKQQILATAARGRRTDPEIPVPFPVHQKHTAHTSYFLMGMDFDPNLVQHFANVRRFAAECGGFQNKKDRLAGACTEKTRLAWVRWEDLRKPSTQSSYKVKCVVTGQPVTLLKVFVEQMRYLQQQQL